MAKARLPAPPKRKPLTSTELEMMNVIWRLGPSTVAQVREALRPARELAYTSVSTILRILEQKGYLRSTAAGRGHVYSPAVAQEDYQALSLDLLVRDVFNGAPSLVVRQLVDSGALGEEDLARIRTEPKKKEGAR
jgi:predicted transcriptional regulator